MLQPHAAAARAANERVRGVNRMDRRLSIGRAGHGQANTAWQYRAFFLFGGDHLGHERLLQFVGFELPLHARPLRGALPSARAGFWKTATRLPAPNRVGNRSRHSITGTRAGLKLKPRFRTVQPTKTMVDGLPKVTL